MGELYQYYARHAPDMRRRVLLTTHTALVIACDDDADQIQTRHIEVAITETNND